MRLRASLGDDALWIMPRLWSYAAENCPDGDLSSMAPKEIAFAIGYNKDAQVMLEALQQAGFVDNGQLKNWHERNAYHAVFAARAKKAAKAKWDKVRALEKGKDKKGKETSNATSREEAFKSTESRAFVAPFLGAFELFWKTKYTPNRKDVKAYCNWRSNYPKETPERLVEVSKYHWQRGKHVPTISRTLQGVFENWSTLSSQMNGQQKKVPEWL